MGYSKQQKKYIDSVDGDAHMSAVEIIGQLTELLKIAKCPNCNGDGVIVHKEGGCDMDGENDTRECVIEQCQWCYERAQLIEEI